MMTGNEGSTAAETMEFRRHSGAVLLVDRSAKFAMRATGMYSGLLKRAWSRAPLVQDGQALSLAVEMGEPVGISQVIPAPAIRSCDPCLFARRSLNRAPSRVIVTEEVPRTSVVSLIGASVSPGVWSLRVAYFGEVAPPEPTDLSALERNGIAQDDALDWWLCHAFLFGRGGPEFASDEVVEATWDDVLQMPESRWRKPKAREGFETDVLPPTFPVSVTHGDGEQPEVASPREWEES